MEAWSVCYLKVGIVMIYGRDFLVVVVVFLALSCGGGQGDNVFKQDFTVTDPLVEAKQQLALIQKPVANYFHWVKVELNADETSIERTLDENGMKALVVAQHGLYEEKALNDSFERLREGSLKRINSEAVTIQYALITNDAWKALDAMLVSFLNFRKVEAITIIEDCDGVVNRHNFESRLRYLADTMSLQDKDFTYVAAYCVDAKKFSKIFINECKTDCSVFFIRHRILSKLSTEHLS